jgi:hypothetical protein
MLGTGMGSATRERPQRSGRIVEPVEVHSPVDHSLKTKRCVDLVQLKREGQI